MGIFHGFKMTCDNNSIHEEPALWLFPCFVREYAGAALMARLPIKEDSFYDSLKGVPTTHFEAVRHLLERYISHDIISEMDS